MVLTYDSLITSPGLSEKGTVLSLTLSPAQSYTPGRRWTMPRNPSSRGRVHIVLIPGFAGFDALGQLEYYAGVTPQFQLWRKSGDNSRADVALHYFDNFPTAAVRTRAARLRNYLATRLARGEFVRGDSIALVGHSTGGLDIRCLLWELNKSPQQAFPVDGAVDPEHMVTPEDILKLVKRVVFLSVPQWGTNVADWVRSYKLGRQMVVENLRAGFAGSQMPIVDTLEEWIWNYASKTTRMGMVDAVRDVVSESETGSSRNPTVVATAQEAASEVELWLRHIATDFHAIDDLAVQGDAQSPARFGKKQRQEEEEIWKKAGIVTRSYATLGERPFRFKAGEAAPRWDLLNPLTYPETTPRTNPSPNTDVIYRIGYRACAGGPFAYRNGHTAPTAKPFFPAGQRPRNIEVWDNDGIVNTASMFWPNGKDTLLVHCDHLDIVGHYHDVRSADKDSRRRFQAYDLLKSDSGFNAAGFARVWNDVFDFCIS